MPFEETGTQELLQRVLPTGRLRLTDRIQEAAGADYVVLTLGTPTHVHIEIDVSQIRLGPLSLLWWWGGVLGPLIAVLAALVQAGGRDEPSAE